MVLQREHADEGLRTAATFARTLSDLKGNGCNLLVVGNDHEPTRSEVCCRLLGCGGAKPRRRLLIAADASVDAVRERLPQASITPGYGQDTIVDWQTPIRGVAAATGASRSVRTVEVGADDLGGLGIAIHDWIEADDSASEPGRLRFCFDSLMPLLTRYDRETAFRFLHLVTGTVDRAGCMAHFHLPVGRNAEATRTVAPLFDAIVELRTELGRPEQRWHVPEKDLVTDWLSV